MTLCADLILADPQAVAALAERLSALHRVEATSVPRAGLALLAHRDAVAGQPFHLGEIPLATASVIVTNHDGHQAAGGAAVIDDRNDRATAIAICDAVQRGNLEGSAEVIALAQSGVAERQRREAERRDVRERTRVNFAELGQDDEVKP
jgi:phosphonate C-P lyase system protein PhnG